ncbi:MAG: hypothetical protein WCJ19_03180 [bacterium]
MKIIEDKTLYMEGDLVEITGRYKCQVCGKEEMFMKNSSFPICENCRHGNNEDIWLLIEEIESIEFGSI